MVIASATKAPIVAKLNRKPAGTNLVLDRNKDAVLKTPATRMIMEPIQVIGFLGILFSNVYLWRLYAEKV